MGKAVGAVALPATGGKTVSLTDLRGKVVVLYFYPKDSTPGCTLEGQDFTRLHKEFRKAGAEVFGVSRDSLASHEKFKAHQAYSIDLLSDEKEDMCKQFEVIKMKNMYGRKVRGIERSTFVIDRDGTLKKEWRGVKVAGHAEDVLDFVKSL
jgi:thioredoxin-dependent peroxiredoxin